MKNKALYSDKELSVYFMDNFPFFIADSYGIEKTSCKLHCHDTIEINYVKEGTGAYIINGKTYTISKGDVFVINNHDIHMAFDEKGVVMQVVMFDWRILCPIVSHPFGVESLKPFWMFSSIRDNKINDSHDYYHKTVEQIAELEYEFSNKKIAYKQAIVSGLLNLSVIFARHFNLPESENAFDRIQNLNRITPVLEYIKLNLNKKISLKDLAICINTSVPNFCKIFKNTIGISPIEYLNHSRVVKAAELLTETDFKIIEIAEECGFFTLSNFINTFKKYTNKAPLKFRNDAF